MRVVVIGAGIVGAACARELALRGLEVRVLDRGRPGQGTTAHGEGNLLVSDKGPGAELDLALLSRRVWPEVLVALAEQLGPDAVTAVEWEPKGGIVVAPDDAAAAVLHDFAATQVAAGVHCRPLSPDELHAAEPHAAPATAAYHYPDDAQVQPVAAATTLLASAVAAGAVLEPDVEVVDALRSGERLVGVRTSRGDVAADAVLVAAGPWSGQLGTRLGAPLDVRPRRGEILVTTPQPPLVRHKVYAADYVTAVGSDEATMQTSAVVESTRAGTVLIGSTRRRVGFDATMGPAQYAALAAAAVALFPALAAVPVLRAYGGFRPYAPDHLPVIGADPRLPGLWHATGHEGAGIGLSVGTARLLADLLAGEQVAPWAAELAPRPAVFAEAFA